MAHQVFLSSALCLRFFQYPFLQTVVSLLSRHCRFPVFRCQTPKFCRNGAITTSLKSCRPQQSRSHLAC